jgi:hypothetical protein
VDIPPRSQPLQPVHQQAAGVRANVLAIARNPSPAYARQKSNDHGRVRSATERLVFKRMTGVASGLSATTRHELEALDELFDAETHGQRMLATESMSWLQGRGPLPVLPVFDERSFMLFANRYLETMWMVHRLVPLTRPHTAPVPYDWRGKWIVPTSPFRRTPSRCRASYPLG